jgi:hypothetical protein
MTQRYKMGGWTFGLGYLVVCESIKGGDHASHGPDVKARVDLCGAGQENILAEAPGEQSYVGEVPGRGPVE